MKIEFIRKLDGKLYIKQGDEEKLAADNVKTLRTATGEEIIEHDGEHYKVKVEKPVQVKSAEDLPTAIKQMQDHLLNASQDRETMNKMVSTLTELVRNMPREGRPGWEQGERTPDQAVTVDEIMTTRAGATYTYRNGQFDEKPPTDKQSSKLWEFQKRADELYMTSTAIRQPVQALKRYQEFKEWAKKNGFERALSSGAAGSGSEWIPTEYSPRLYEKLRLQLNVLNNFETVQMPAPTYPYPLQVTDATAYFVPENTANEGVKAPASTMGTGNFTFNAKKFKARQVVSEEQVEDNVFPLIPAMERNAVQAIANALEQAAIDGDTTATHQDSDVTASTDARKAFKGFRKLASDKSAQLDFNDSFPTALQFNNLRAQLAAAAGRNPANLIWLFSFNTFVHLLADTTAILAWDKMAQRASILTGDLPLLYNIPVIISEFSRIDLNASGVYDGSATDDRQSGQIIYTPGFKLGVRKAITLENEKDIHTGQWTVVSTMRGDFVDVYGSGEATVADGYNIDDDADA